MKKSDIIEGGVYLAEVSKRMTKVRVDEIKQDGGRVPFSPADSYADTVSSRVIYHCTILESDEDCTIRSPKKFKSAVKEKKVFVFA